ncbi:hypothetical protein MAPG_10633 [Magnaporthiopsis poae ATCC 64411]|uniref:Uncharacterized protein n=1 Tax=Magnaporthiopsis poae (strain ATCC 64411 / 73-15) TaxID=644358 RepID=A0A0C4ED40_MAGP6|nr:hypothetical protein MAPG_10633 [Magnaporthiopsis poae ATCC 64411]
MMFNANLVLLAATALGSLAVANPAPMAMGVEVLEQNGSLMVREVATSHAPVEKRCRECVHVGGHCTIGHGSCYAKERASCTWCGNKCKSICIPNGDACQKWCL